MLIFCRRIVINKPQILKKKGPLLLACNHPNSFLDATILADLFEMPVYSLARGDVFRKRHHTRLLTALKILPIYRTSEGVENLNINYDTFDACKKIFKEGGIVLIFSEGQCINEWHLRPLKKGTARLAFRAWEENIPVEILPVGINYSSFRRFSKNVFINFGQVISPRDFDLDHADGRKYQSFTNKLQEQLNKLVFEIDKADVAKQRQLLEIRLSLFLKVILFIPAMAGWLANALLYLPLKTFTYQRTKNNDHYDSVLIALLLFIYPLYVIIISLSLVMLTHNQFFWCLVILLPLTALAYVQVKPQLDKRKL